LQVYIILFLEWLALILLILYLEVAVPSTPGVPKQWCFCLKPCRGKKKASDSGAAAGAGTGASASGAGDVQLVQIQAKDRKQQQAAASAEGKDASDVEAAFGGVAGVPLPSAAALQATGLPMDIALQQHLAENVREANRSPTLSFVRFPCSCSWR
jgi:hypothetical protein